MHKNKEGTDHSHFLKLSSYLHMPVHSASACKDRKNPKLCFLWQNPHLFRSLKVVLVLGI